MLALVHMSHQSLIAFWSYCSQFFSFRCSGQNRAVSGQGEPDHLVTELEFLHFLSFQEVQLGAAGEDVGGLLRAQRDFIERHPGAWVPALCKRLAEREAPRLFRELAGLLERFLRQEQARLALQIDDGATAH